MSKLAILIPHKRSPANDQALVIAMACIAQNTTVDYQVFIDAETPACPYRAINAMAWCVDAEYIVFSNSDVFFGPGWAEPMLAAASPDTIITGVLVEPGAIPVSDQNVTTDFGMTPDTFDRRSFEQWAAESPVVPSGEGWYFPSMHHRRTFLDQGGFDIQCGSFPDPLDKYYWQEWRESGRRVKRVPSFAYHLQNWSNEDEQGKAVRHG